LHFPNPINVCPYKTDTFLFSKRYGAQIKKYSNRTTDRIVPPTSAQKGPTGRHKLLDGDGIASVGERIEPGDVYVNKQSPSNTRDPLPNPQAMPDSFFRPTPQSYKGPQGEACVVDKVMLTMTDEGQFNVKCLVYVSWAFPNQAAPAVCRLSARNYVTLVARKTDTFRVTIAGGTREGRRLGTSFRPGTVRDGPFPNPSHCLRLSW